LRDTRGLPAKNLPESQ